MGSNNWSLSDVWNAFKMGVDGAYGTPPTGDQINSAQNLDQAWFNGAITDGSISFADSVNSGIDNITQAFYSLSPANWLPSGSSITTDLVLIAIIALIALLFMGKLEAL